MPKTTLPRLSDCPDVAGKYVVVRASLNVPLTDGVVANQFRIVRAVPTIRQLQQSGAKVIVISHIGRDHTDTLAPVSKVLQSLVPHTFIPHTLGSEVETARAAMQNGEVLLLENVRQDPRETDDDGSFAAALASLGDVYINDAFAASHRDQASLTGIASRLPTYFGLNFMHEYDELMKAKEPDQPSIFILGGAKFDTKLPLVEQYLELYTNIFVGGALANDIFKARGLEVGQSLVSDIDLSDSPLIHNDRVMTPIDVVVDGPNGRRTCPPDVVAADERILDAGPQTIALLAPMISAAKMILWNGPLGDYEHGFGQHTEALAEVIASAKGYAVIGGGDTIAAVENLRVQESIGFMSTAGGAMLTFLEAGTLPAIDVVLQKS